MAQKLTDALRRYAEKDGRGYPDWVLRYEPCVQAVRAKLQPGVRILEIGANENGLARFVDYPVLAVDVSEAHLRAARAAQHVAPVLGTAAALPFPSEVFDVCVCMDTLEHIPETLHEAIAREIVRVLKSDGMAVLTFPSGNAALRAEQAIQSEYRRLTGNTISWLDEHRALGLPDGERVAAIFRDAAAGRFEVRTQGITPLWLWRWTWRVLMCQWPGRGNAFFQVLLRWCAPGMARLRHAPYYRLLLLLSPREHR